MKAKKTPSLKISDASPAEIADIVPEYPTAPFENLAGSPAAATTSNSNLPARTGPGGDLDDEDLDFCDPFSELSSHPTPDLLGPEFERFSTEQFQRFVDEQPQRDKRRREDMRRRDVQLQRFVERVKERHPYRRICAGEVADWISRNAESLESKREKENLFYATLARDISSGAFKTDGPWAVLLLPTTLKPHAWLELRMTRSQFHRLADLYGGAKAFNSEKFQLEVMAQLILPVDGISQWLRENGLPDLPPKFGAEAEVAPAPETPGTVAQGRKPAPGPETTSPDEGIAAPQSQREKDKAETVARDQGLWDRRQEFRETKKTITNSEIARRIIKEDAKVKAAKGKEIAGEEVKKRKPPTESTVRRILVRMKKRPESQDPSNG